MKLKIPRAVFRLTKQILTYILPTTPKWQEILSQYIVKINLQNHKFYWNKFKILLCDESAFFTLSNTSAKLYTNNKKFYFNGIEYIVNSWHKWIIMDLRLNLHYVSHMSWRQEFYKISKVKGKRKNQVNINLVWTK